MKEKYPLKLQPVFKETIWGGNRLKREFSKECDLKRLAESWELTCRKCEMNLITNGRYAGMTLGEYLGDFRGFPLLVKLIDANDSLSIQVHPDDDYARKNEGTAYGKTEMWYIVDALPGAQIVYGLKEQFNRDKFSEAIRNGNLKGLLNYTDVHKGDVFFIPSGCVHAIGSGIIIAEIQQSCDITYRVYDYDRTDASGNKRELHIEKALDVIKNFDKAEIENLQFSNGTGENIIVNCKYFRVRKITANAVINTSDRFAHLLCLSGSGKIGNEIISKGDSFYIPAGTGDINFCCENAEILVSEPNLQLQSV